MHKKGLNQEKHGGVGKIVGKNYKIPQNIPQKQDIIGTHKKLDKFDITCMKYDDMTYKDIFQGIYHPPEKLYLQGNLGLLHDPKYAIVGPRKPSRYAQEVIKHLFVSLPHYHLVTLSGGAVGVDTLVHTMSMEYNIPTIVVLAGGIQYFHHSTHGGMLQKVLQSGGLLISEYENEITPKPYSFPQRNRIIAGLAKVVFLPEAKQKSGSLITAKYAHKMKIPVYATMNNIFSLSSYGTNQAIEKGWIKPLVDLENTCKQYFVEKNSSSRRGLQKEKHDNILYHGCEGESGLSIQDMLIQDMQRTLFGE